MWDLIVLIPDHCLSIYFFMTLVCILPPRLALRVGVGLDCISF